MQQIPAVYCKASRFPLNSRTVWSSARKFYVLWTWSNFAHAPASCASTPADVTTWPSDSVQLKFDQYVAQPPISPSCPMRWWSEHKTSYQIFSQPSIYIDGWLYAMRMTSVVCNVPVLSQNDSTYHHSVFTTWKWHPFATWTPSFIILVWGHHPLIGAKVFACLQNSRTPPIGSLA